MKKNAAYIDLKKASKSLKSLAKDLKVDPKIEIEEERVVWLFDTSMKAYDDNVIAHFEFFANGTALFGFTFDHLEINAETLALINEFNEKNYYFCAYIDAKKKYLRLVHTIGRLYTDDVYDYALFVMGELTEETLTPLLAPLCTLSVGDPN